jgi:hypothetical protein
VSTTQPDGLLEGEEIVAMLSVRYSASAPTSLDAAPKAGIHRPSVVQRHAYAFWSRHSSSIGFPVAGPEMILGITQDRLVVWSPTFFGSRPRRFAGAIPLSRIQRAGVHRQLFASVLTLLFENGAIVGVETMRGARLRRFAAAIPSFTEYKPR